MKETCFYCYYHSRCSRDGCTDTPVCEYWRPAVLPARAVEHLYDEFLKQANALLAHVYSDNQRIAMMNYLRDKGDQIEYAFDCYKSVEMPLDSGRKNTAAYEHFKNKSRRY